MGKDSLSEAQGRRVTGTGFDQLATALERKARRLSLRATGRPVASQLDYTAEGPSLPNSPTPRTEPGEHAALFTKHHTAPVWSPSQHENVMVMQQTPREAWNCLGRRFKAVAAAASYPASHTSPHHTRALAVESGRRRSIAHGHHGGDSPQRERRSRPEGGGSLPDQRLLSPASAKVQPRSPVTAVVRVGTGRISTLLSRQLRRLF